MIQYILVFFITWFFGLLNRAIQDLSDNTVFWAALLHVVFVPWQGFWNAIVYGGLLETKLMRDCADSLNKFFCCCKNDRRCFKDFRASLLHNAAPTLSRNMASNSREGGIWAPKRNASKKKVSLFVTTYNLAEKAIDELGDLNEWIMPGHDMYAIGVQECMYLEALRGKLWENLGGPTKYKMFEAEIGSTNTALGFHGMIAVTVFVKAADVESGAFFMPESNASEVKKGADLIVTKAANKGAVGLPFIYHDTSMAFFTGHFAANSKGRNRLKARLDDSRDTLSKTVLTSHDIKFDSHLVHHFVFVFGDLNFRCVSNPSNVLSLVSEACKKEMESTWGGDKNWRREAYKLLEAGRTAGGGAKKLSKSALEAWAKVLKLDELRLIMSYNEIFTNFEEPGGLPAFPPSFRRKMGPEGACGDYTDYGRILNAYTTSVIEKSAKEDDKRNLNDGKEEVGPLSSMDGRSIVNESLYLKPKLGERIPSYTDRILFHALPDKTEDIIVGSYEICDQMVGSDHRPVSATFEILVDEDIKRGDVLDVAAGSTDDDEGSDSVEIAPTNYQSTNNGQYSKNYGTRCFVRMKANNMEYKAVSDKASDGSDQSAEEDSASRAEEVVMVFPLPTEDPIVEERRVHAIARTIGGAGQGRKAIKLKTKDSKEVCTITQHALMENERRTAWKSCTGIHSDGVTMISECRPELGAHALIKVNDKTGRCLGQGVVGFGKFMLNLTSGETVISSVKVDLSLGAKKVGELECVFHLTELFSAAALPSSGESNGLNVV